MKIIVINNPAAKEGGALTILENFLIYLYKRNRDKVYVFVTEENLKKYEKENLKIIILKKQNFITRIIWDNFKLKKYLKKNNIIPDIFISLQNTGVNIDRTIYQLIYFHQALSLSDSKWNFFKKNEKKYWFYEKIYPFFIRQYLKNQNKVIVQANWIREEFSLKYFYDKRKIKVLKPKVKKIDTENIKKIDKQKFRIFFPAAPLLYKNHIFIVEALKSLKEEQKLLDIECIFTFSIKDNIELYNLIKEYKIENLFRFIGKIQYEEVLEYYNSSDLLVFPSFIETIGLPLIEAQEFNLKIIAIDLPYSREVLKEYDKVIFIKKNENKKIVRDLKEILKKIIFESMEEGV